VINPTHFEIGRIEAELGAARQSYDVCRQRAAGTLGNVRLRSSRTHKNVSACRTAKPLAPLLSNPPRRLLAVSAPPMTQAAQVWAREQGLAAAEALKSCEGVAVGPPSAWRCRPLSAAGWRRVDPRFAAP
jgi:hypothetical protein